MSSYGRCWGRSPNHRPCRVVSPTLIPASRVGSAPLQIRRPRPRFGRRVFGRVTDDVWMGLNKSLRDSLGIECLKEGKRKNVSPWVDFNMVKTLSGRPQEGRCGAHSILWLCTRNFIVYSRSTNRTPGNTSYHAVTIHPLWPRLHHGRLLSQASMFGVRKHVVWAACDGWSSLLSALTRCKHPNWATEGDVCVVS